MLPPPSMPTTCAVTPTHAMPSRIISVCAEIQSGAASTPPLTLFHSTMTVPLKRCRSVGRKTMMRVLYDAVDAGAAGHLPSEANGPAGIQAVAVPEMKNSISS